VINTTVQPKAVMFPTDTKLINRTSERLMADAAGVKLLSNTTMPRSVT